MSPETRKAGVEFFNLLFQQQSREKLSVAASGSGTSNTGAPNYFNVLQNFLQTTLAQGPAGGGANFLQMSNEQRAQYDMQLSILSVCQPMFRLFVI